MPRGVFNTITKDDLRARIKEIEGRIAQMDRRDKSLVELKKWLVSHKLEISDLAWMLKQMQPQRADKPVKSKHPLQPKKAARGAYFTHNGKLVPAKGDPEFRRAVREARIKQELHVNDVAKKLGLSGNSISNWEAGRYVPSDEARLKLLKVLGLPLSLGAAASKAQSGGAPPGE